MNPDQRRLVLEQTKQKLADTRQKRQQQEEERKWNLAMILDKDSLSSSRKTMTSEELAKLLKDVDADKPEKQVKQTNLRVTTTHSVDVPSKNANITYSKATQTEEESCESAVDSLTYQDTQVSKREVGGQKESEDCVKQEQPPAIDSEVVSSIEAKTVEPADLVGEMHIPEIAEDQRNQILQSQDFNQFFCQSTRIIERALEDDKDIFVDYTTADRHVHEIQSMCKELLSFNAEFSMDQFTSNRYVRSLDYSSFYPELLVVAYDRNPYEPLAPGGIVKVWNTFFKTSPESTLHSSSRVTSMLCDKFQPNIIVAGCYSGQICVWDTRVNKKTPMCKTKLSKKMHVQPVMCMQMVGSENSHELVTLSTNGVMCSWTMDNLLMPTETLSLAFRPTEHEAKPKTVNSTPGRSATADGSPVTMITALSMSFFRSDISSFVIGSEEKALYLGNRHMNKGEITRCIEAHGMPLTCVDMHRALGPSDFSRLCLSGSMDFDVKLWDVKDDSITSPLITFKGLQSLHIADVQWSPVHPAVFATASIDGILNLWNLNESTKRYIVSLKISGSITKLMWSRNGKQLSVADIEGRVFLYDVNESLYNVRLSEWDNFSQTLTTLKLMSRDIALSER